ncbi:DUF3237 domain-containing protein [Undibacterium sp. TJN25]|uniref:DUF3237 domain-containing protein n=1 Tax=Undibacterium sp. TJN25 TaxID=3413056 RepID=UPI003BF39C5C
MTLLMPRLEHIADLTVFVDKPVEAGKVTGLNSRGLRRIIPITGGTVSGKLNGDVLAGGADFQMVVSDSASHLDARYILQLDNGARVYVQNHAIRRGPAEQIARLVRGEQVDPALIYFRCVPSFEVDHDELLWLTDSVFVGTGARYPDRVEMAFFRVE